MVDVHRRGRVGTLCGRRKHDWWVVEVGRGMTDGGGATHRLVAKSASRPRASGSRPSAARYVFCASVLVLAGYGGQDHFARLAHDELNTKHRIRLLVRGCLWCVSQEGYFIRFFFFLCGKVEGSPTGAD